MQGKETFPKVKIIDRVSTVQIVNDFFKLDYEVFPSEVIPDFSSFLIK